MASPLGVPVRQAQWPGRPAGSPLFGSRAQFSFCRTMSRSVVRSLANARMPPLSISVAIASSFISQRKRFSSISTAPPARSDRARACARAGRRLSASSSQQGGAIVSRSQPASASICPVERNEAPITTVADAARLVVVVDVADRQDAGILLGRVGLARRLLVPVGRSGRRTARSGRRRRRRRRWPAPCGRPASGCSRCPICCSSSAARMPSQVAASLTRMRSRLIWRSA